MIGRLEGVEGVVLSVGFDAQVQVAVVLIQNGQKTQAFIIPRNELPAFREAIPGAFERAQTQPKIQPFKDFVDNSCMLTIYAGRSGELAAVGLAITPIADVKARRPDNAVLFSVLPAQRARLEGFLDETATRLGVSKVAPAPGAARAGSTRKRVEIELTAEPSQELVGEDAQGRRYSFPIDASLTQMPQEALKSGDRVEVEYSSGSRQLALKVVRKE